LADDPDETEATTFLPELCRIPALALLILVGELLACALLLGAGEMTWARFGVLSLFVQWVALTSAAAICLCRPWLQRLRDARAGIAAWLLVVAVTFVLALLGEGVLGMEAPSMGSSGAVEWMTVVRVTGVGAILSGLVLRYLYVQQRLRSREQSELRLRLQALQSRIRPHFLFNSMNSIASLIEVDPDTAETVVEDLAELFRASLNEAGNQVPLQTELDLCERYLRIEQLRLGERLRVDWNMDPIPHGVEIPLLTLQPLVENAVYHGIQPLPQGGTIAVTVEIGDDVRLTVANPLPPSDAAEQRHAQGNRMAIANIRSRLSVLYGRRASLRTRREEHRFVTELSYPVTGGGDQASQAVAPEATA